MRLRAATLVSVPSNSSEQLCRVAVISKSCLSKACDIHLYFGRYGSLDLAYNVTSK